MKKALFYMVMCVCVSCKQEIIVNIDNKPPVTVINAELDCNRFMAFQLSLTQNITDNSDKKSVEEAIIYIMDEDSTVIETIQHSGNGLYQATALKPELSKRYLFRIQDSRGLYWADETMPDSLTVKTVDTSRIVFQGVPNFMQFKVSIMDKADKRNYYGLRIQRVYDIYQNGDTVQKEEWVNIESLDLILTEDPVTRFSKTQKLFSDRYFNGLLQEIKFGTGGLFGRPEEKTKALNLYFSAYSENSFRYYSSLNEHLLYQNDPFSQPTMLSGNVTHAYGAIIVQNTALYRFEFQ